MMICAIITTQNWMTNTPFTIASLGPNQHIKGNNGIFDHYLSKKQELSASTEYTKFTPYTFKDCIKGDTTKWHGILDTHWFRTLIHVQEQTI